MTSRVLRGGLAVCLVSCGGSFNAAPPDNGSPDAGAGGAGARASNSGGRAPGGAGGKAAGGASNAGGQAGEEQRAGLRVQGNRILLPDGSRFHGRGANLNDTRSCDACSSGEPDVEGLNRWADELLRWGANFVRFNLWSFDSDNGFRRQWQSVVDDAAYLADIEATVSHMTRNPDVYVLVTVFLDPSIEANNDAYDSEWPTAETLPVYEALAEALADNPQVLFGLTNEPHGPAEHNPELAERYLAAIDAIRAVEARLGVPEHLIAVQAPQEWARYLDYFIEEPIERSGIVYEVHVYNPVSDFDRLLNRPSRTLPIIVGEYGPSQFSTYDDVRALWERCQSLEIPHVAWTFHLRCPPNLLEDVASDGCGLSADTGYDFPRTEWGDLLYEYLQTPW